MTTIAAAKLNGQISICSDSLISGAHSRLGYINKLIFLEKNEEADVMNDTTIGVSGSPTMLRALIAVFNEANYHFGDVDEVYASLRDIHEELKTHHGLMVEIDDGDDQMFESSQMELLIVNGTGIYQIHQFRDVFVQEEFGAVGSGAEYAMGAMQALYEQENMDSDLLVKRAVEIAATYDKATALPHYLSTVQAYEYDEEEE